MKKIIAVLLIALLYGCGSTGSTFTRPSITDGAFKNFEINELEEMYRKKELGRIDFWVNQSVVEYPSFKLWCFLCSQTIDVGNLRGGEGFSIYLLPGKYWAHLAASGKNTALDFNIVGGQTNIYKWERIGSQPIEVNDIPSNIRILATGSVFYKQQIAKHVTESRQPKFTLSHTEAQGLNLTLKIHFNDKASVGKVMVNEIDKSFILAGNQDEINHDLSVGDNIINVRIIDKAGYEKTQQIKLTVLSEQEKERMAQQAREEQQKKERQALAKKIEEERIAREGDDSPDDLLCKKYGFKPRTSGYAECRLRIDFAKAESMRQREQYEREQAEYQRRLAAIERDKERQRGARLLELGARMMGGQRPIEALSSLGTGAPIAPTRPSNINQTIRLPNGQIINCSTMGAMTNCF